MSSEIFYDKAFIRVDDRYIPVVNHGSSNCFDFDSHGREIPEKHWSVLNYTRRDRQIFTAEEMQHIAEVYETASMSNRGGTRKSRNRSFEEGEFGRWILAGMKSAHTVEEYKEYGNTVVVIDYSDSYWQKHSVYTTEELMEKLKELEGRSITVSFWDDRHVTHPPMRRKSQPFDFSQLSEFYVLSAAQGYFVKRSSRRIWFARNQKPTSTHIRKFKTEKAAQKYLDDNQSFFSKCAFTIECVKNGGAAI